MSFSGLPRPRRQKKAGIFRGLATIASSVVTGLADREKERRKRELEDREFEERRRQDAANRAERERDDQRQFDLNVAKTKRGFNERGGAKIGAGEANPLATDRFPNQVSDLQKQGRIPVPEKGLSGLTNITVADWVNTFSQAPDAIMSQQLGVVPALKSALAGTSNEELLNNQQVRFRINGILQALRIPQNIMSDPRFQRAMLAHLQQNASFYFDAPPGTPRGERVREFLGSWFGELPDAGSLIGGARDAFTGQDEIDRDINESMGE